MANNKTGFDDYFEKQLRDPSFAKEYAAARSTIDATDDLIRALDAARIDRNLSKAELARLVDCPPEALRRLFTTKAPNPGVVTVLKLASALGYRLVLLKDAKHSAARASDTRRQVRAPQRSRAKKAS